MIVITPTPIEAITIGIMPASGSEGQIQAQNPATEETIMELMFGVNEAAKAINIKAIEDRLFERTQRHCVTIVLPEDKDNPRIELPDGQCLFR